jgi:uncharacterized protein YsxB (DUF464 family)
MALSYQTITSISQFEFLFEQLFIIKLFQCFHIQMVVVPFLRNNPSAVMFFQRFIFSAKKFREKYSEHIKQKQRKKKLRTAIE